MADADPLLGRTIGGKFIIEHFLGGGAMGSVYRAKQVALDKDVAVKILHTDMAREPAFVARFHREAMAASRLDHASSVRVLDFGEDNGLLYIVMEYLAGRDLLTVMNEEWPLDDRRIATILSQVLAALAVAHDQGIVHRDLKPENIMVLEGMTDEGEPMDLVKVCDFGIATIAGASDDDPTAPKLTAKGLVMGTPDYMSPEQARGEKLDARSDLYSVGVILYHLLTGRTPFAAENAIGIALKHVSEPVTPPSATTDDVDAQLERVCLRALEKSREARYQSARQMRGDLRSVLEAHGASLPPIPSARTGSGGGVAIASSGRRISEGANKPPSSKRAGTVGYVEPQGRGTMAFDAKEPQSAPHSSRGTPRVRTATPKASGGAVRKQTLPALPAPFDEPEISVRSENNIPVFGRDAETTAAPQLIRVEQSPPEQRTPPNGNFPALSSNEIQVMVDDPKSSPTPAAAPPKKKSRAGVVAVLLLLCGVAGAAVYVSKHPQLIPRGATEPTHAPAQTAPTPVPTSAEAPLTASATAFVVEPPPVVETAEPSVSTTATTTAPQKGQKVAVVAKPTATSKTTTTAAIAPTVTAAPEPTPTATVTAAPTPTPTVTAAPTPTPTPVVTAAPKPTVDPNTANVSIAGVSTTNGLNASNVRNAVSHAPFAKCYRDALAAKGAPAQGTGTLFLSISESGSITGASLNAGFLPSVKGCIEGAVRGLRVKDVDTGDATATVTLSFTHK